MSNLMSYRSFYSDWFRRHPHAQAYRHIDPDESESDISSFFDPFRRALVSGFRYLYDDRQRQPRPRHHHRREHARRRWDEHRAKRPRMEAAVEGARSENDPGFSILRSMCVELLRSKRITPFMLELRGLAQHHADYSLIESTVKELGLLENALGELIDLFQIYLIRTQFVLRYTAIAMESIVDTLYHMLVHLKQIHLHPEERWHRLLHEMAVETRNLSICNRIHVYAQFIRTMGDVIRGSTAYNVTVARESYKIIGYVRSAQGIPEVDPILGESIPFGDLGAYTLHVDKRHWSQGVFFPPTPQQTPFRQQVRSKSLGPHQPFAPMDTAPNPFILMMRKFDNNITLSAVMNTDNDTVCILIRTIVEDRPWYSLRRIEDVYIRRSHSALNLYQRSKNSHEPTPWAVLNFTNWEDLILFYCAFISLKLQNSPTARIRNTEAAFHGEDRCYETKIDIEGSIHRLMVLEDCYTGNIRLHAQKMDSGSVGRPAWTAFLTQDFTISTHSSRLLILRGVQPHAFWRGGFTPNARQPDLALHFLHKQDQRDFASVIKHIYRK